MTTIELIQKLSKVTDVYKPVSVVVGYDGYATTACITDVTDMGICILLGACEAPIKEFVEVMKDVNTEEEKEKLS